MQPYETAARRTVDARTESAAFYGQRARTAWSGRYAQRLSKLCLEVYGDTCHLCGHPGADSADHVIPRARGGTDELSNLRPAHYRACIYCRVRCNTQRGARLLPPSRPPFTDGADYID